MFKALATECRRDVSLLSPSLLASINLTLTSLSSDLEVAARAASVVSITSMTKLAHPYAYVRHTVLCMDNLYRWSPHRSRQACHRRTYVLSTSLLQHGED